MKKGILALAAIICVVVSVTSASGSAISPTPVPTKMAGLVPSPTPGGAKPTTGVTYVYNSTDWRVEMLNEKLCYPISDLVKLSDADLQKMVEQNAEKLGILVYAPKKDSAGKVMTDKYGQKIPEVVAGNGVRNIPDCKNNIPQSTPTPLLPYPAPGQGATSTPQAKLQEPTKTPAANLQPMTIWPIWIPIIRSLQETIVIENLMDKAKGYIDRLYQDDGNAGPYGFAKEYMGCPVSIFDNNNPTDYRSTRFAGDYYGFLGPTVGDVFPVATGYAIDIAAYTFEDDYNWQYGEPNLTCEIHHNDDFTTSYHIIKESWTGDPGNDTLYLGDLALFTNVYNTPDNTEAIVNKDVGQAFPSIRYTVRHVGSLAKLFYNLNTDPWKVYQLNNVITEYGFDEVPDIYAPLFESGIDAPDDYFYYDAAYHDCDIFLMGLDRDMSWGHGPYRYPYESKVCIARPAYIELTTLDYLVPALQALHIMQKYDNPDHVYQDGNLINRTPRQIARWIESNGWNGHGISAFGKDPAYASGVRTFAFLGLESMLGWKYGDTTSQNYATQTIRILKEIQWGSDPFDTYEGAVVEGGYEIYMYRPMFQGAAMLGWVPGQSWPYALPPRSIRDDIMDLVGMPQEALLPNPSNGETTLTYWAALRLYMKYKWGTSYPN